MTKFLVVLSDSAEERVPLGDSLVRFLNCYAGGEVKVTTPGELLRGQAEETEILFIALPTTFHETHATRVRWRQLVLFDYYDEIEPKWQQSEEAFLSSLTDRCWKTQNVEGFDFGLRMGNVPPPLSTGIGREYDCLRYRRPWRRLGAAMGREERPWDVAFLGAVTFLEEEDSEGIVRRYHQRVDWLREVRGRKDWQFRGGLLELPYFQRADLEAECGPVSDLLWRGRRLSFREYFTDMTRAKISLAPTGHARWTYRHYESVYAGCEVVSTDFSGIRTLIPLPAHCFEIVPDHAPISPAIERALEEWEERAPRREAAIEYLEQYLYRGRFDARRPELFERFLGQLE